MISNETIPIQHVETPLKSLSYGINAQDRLVIARLPELRVVGPLLSMNAYLDIHTGYQLAGMPPGLLVYCKHALPMFAIHTGWLGWQDRLLSILEINAEREFGCFVYNGTVNSEVFGAIADYRFHTLAAPAVAPDVIDRISGEAFQKRNRKVVVARGRVPVEASYRHGSMAGAHEILYEAEFPADETLLQRCVRLCRTLCICIQSKEGDILLTNSGFVDPMEALRYSFSMLKGQFYEELAVGTDACFGVKNPASLLASHSVSNCTLFGPKNTSASLIDALQDNGIALDWSPDRAFRLSV